MTTDLFILKYHRDLEERMNPGIAIHNIIQDVLDGDSSSFNLIYKQYKRDLFLTCLRYAKNKQEAEDFLQDSFIQVYKNLKHFDFNKGQFKSWIKKISINVCLQHLRKNAVQFIQADLSEVSHLAEVRDMNPIESLSLQELTKKIQQMPSGYRMVFNLYVIDGFSHKEIADFLEINPSTSKSQLFKAKKYLKNILTRNDIQLNYE